MIQYLMTIRYFKIRWTSEEDKVPADLRNKLWAADASYASDVITRRSHGGYMLFLNGGCVSWKSGLQKMVTLSSCESEFVALCSAILEVRYLRQFLNELGHRQEEPTLLWEDNKAAIIVAEGETYQGPTCIIVVRVGREEEGVSSLRAELAAIAGSPS